VRCGFFYGYLDGVAARHNWEQLKTLLSFCLKQVLQDYYRSHVDAAVGPPRPLITGETFQQLQDRLDSGI
jgi:serine/threonine-protein phosphatase 4 regulatory subunit 2